MVQDIPAVTAARSRLVVQAETTLQKQSAFNPVGLIQYVQADHGPAIGRIPVLLVWAVFHISTDVI